MSWKFNPPPGWPVPADWQPPPGFVPDPSWPPAPTGWQFWVPASSSSDTPAAPSEVHDAPTSLAPAGPGPAAPSSPPQPAPSPQPQPQSSQPQPQSSQPQSPQPQFQPAQPYPGGYPAAGAPAPMPPEGKPWHQRWWAIGGAILAVLLVGCVIGSVLALLTNSDEDGGDAVAAGGHWIVEQS